ncbi:hypothetical protein KIW84_065045 [Lathyrus oleraceus]|uniref:Uncharacterized protein n=1 Tax=Pisum sativum TaxID=3888 RepID=A0A9D5ABW1_PEA|nr:hypothetical protein KIW84_065045 [Pisum sativum]
MSRSMPSQNSGPRHQALVAGTNFSPFYNQTWYPDSGETHHVTPDATNLMDSISLLGTDHIQIVNGQGMSHGLPLPISSICPDPLIQVIVSPVPVTPLPSSSPTTSSKVSSQILKTTSNNLVSLKQT